MRHALIMGSSFLGLALGIVVFLTPDVASTTKPRMKPCKGSPSIVGPCFVIHGRYSYANGSPSSRIWIIGTKRRLGVDDFENANNDRPEVPWIPENLEARSGPGIDVFGDFEVCPLSKEKPGEMQFACVESATHLVIKDWNK